MNTLHEILSLCLEHGLSFETTEYAFRTYKVYHFDNETRSFKFNEESSRYGISLEELKNRVEEYVKTL